MADILEQENKATTEAVKEATPKTGFDAYRENATNSINQMYDAQKQAQLGNLEASYNKNLAAAEEARGNIGKNYQQQRNNLATVYERTRKNMNEQAAASGINTGTGTQAALAQRSEYQRDNTSLGNAEANAMTTADRGIADLKTQYQADVNSATAQNDYAKAAALLNQYKEDYSHQLNQAQTLASYGDFSGYASIYGEAQAAAMKNSWAAQNPDLAYRTGAITGEQYKQWTGYYPAGYTAYSSGGWSGGGSGYDGGNDNGNGNGKNITVTGATIGSSGNTGDKKSGSTADVVKVGNVYFNTDGTYNAAVSSAMAEAARAEQAGAFDRAINQSIYNQQQAAIESKIATTAKTNAINNAAITNRGGRGQ